MRLLAIFWLFAAAAATPGIEYFPYQRPIVNLPPQGGQTCVAIESGVFAHALPQLADLRLYRNGVETPYAIHLAAPGAGGEKSIAPLNLGVRGGQAVFHAAMPEGSYSDVALAVITHDFIATVTVTGSQSQAGGAETKLGEFTIFDLTKQKLGRSTVLHLPESDFRYLHFRVSGPVKPEDVSAVSVGRLPAGEPKYVTVAESTTVKQDGHKSVFEFELPARVPVDRVVFAPAAAGVNFSREVRVRAQENSPKDANRETEPQQEESSGNLLRVHSVLDGKEIREEQLTAETPPANFDSPAKWEIAIDNGDDPPIEFKSVRLEMLERTLCFDAAAGAGYVLYYGDTEVSAPRYDYARLFVYDAKAPRAEAGLEQRNAAFRPRPDRRPFTEKHPVLLWAALIAVVALLGLIALRTWKRTALPS